MKKNELIERLCNLLNTIELDSHKDFDDEEIEDLIVEARIPIVPCNGRLHEIFFEEVVRMIRI